MAEPGDFHALRVLRACVDREAAGLDLYDAGDAIRERLTLSPEQYRACVKCLVTGGYLHGGETFTGPFVEGTTLRGRRTVERSRSVIAALDRVLAQLFMAAEPGAWDDAGSRAWGHAPCIPVRDPGGDPDRSDARPPQDPP